MGKKYHIGKPEVDPFVDRAYNKHVPIIGDLARQVMKNWPNLPDSNMTITKGDPLHWVKRDFEAEPEIMDMWWHTKTGEKMRASEMETRHMYYSLRLLYNQTVPPQYRICELTNEQARVKGDTKKAIRILCYLLTQRFRDPARDNEWTDSMIGGFQLMSGVIKDKL